MNKHDDLNERGNPKMSNRRSSYPPTTTMLRQIGTRRAQGVKTVSQLNRTWTEVRAKRKALRDQQKASRRANRGKR